MTVIIAVFGTVPFPSQVKVGLWSLAALLLAHIVYRYCKNEKWRWQAPVVAGFVFFVEVGALIQPISTTLFPQPAIITPSPPQVTVNVMGTNDSPNGQIIFSSGDSPLADFRAWYYFIMTADGGQLFIANRPCANVPTFPPHNGQPRVSFLAGYYSSHDGPVAPISETNTISKVFVYYVYMDPKSGEDVEWPTLYSYDGSQGWQADMVNKNEEPMRTLVASGRKLCQYNGT